MGSTKRKRTRASGKRRPAKAASAIRAEPPRMPPKASSETPPLSLSTLHRTYTGLLDDVMIRYSSDYLGEAFFNKMIAKNVLFGGGLYLNDGYLVNHPIARRFLREDDSLLRVMLHTNFIRLLTRTSSPDGLVNMPDEMARSGSRSFEMLVASNEWQEMRPLYASIAEALYFSHNVRSWPKFEMSAGFTKLVSRMFGAKPSHLGMTAVTRSQLQRLRDEFYRRDPESGNARHQYEQAALAVAARNPRTRKAVTRELMEVGNQGYHYNFGLTLTHEEPNGVAVDTTVGLAFDELLATRSVSRGQIDNIPLIRVPEQLPFDDGDLFRPFLDPASKVGRAKLEYLKALRDLLNANTTRYSDLRKDVRTATDNYLNRIGEVFRARLGRASAEIMTRAPIAMAVGSLDRRSAGDDDVAATSAPTAGLAITLQAQASMAQSRQFLVERFRLVDAEDEFSPSRGRLVTLGDIRPQITSLAFNPQKARDFTSTLPVLGK